MIQRWNYRYELINFQRDSETGFTKCETREEGKISSDEAIALRFRVYSTARKLAEENEKDVVVYVIGNRIIPRVRAVRSASFD